MAVCSELLLLPLLLRMMANTHMAELVVRAHGAFLGQQVGTLLHLCSINYPKTPPEVLISYGAAAPWVPQAP